MKNPTPKQLEALRYIADYQREKGYSPSIRDIADFFGVYSRAAYERVLALRQLGLIDWILKDRRAIRLTDRGRELFMPEQALDTAGNVYEKIFLGG